MNFLKLLNGAAVALVSGLLCFGSGIIISDAYIQTVLPTTTSGPGIWQPLMIGVGVILLGWTFWFTSKIIRETLSRPAGWLAAAIPYLVILTSIGILYIQPALYENLPTEAILAFLIMLAGLYYSSVGYLQHIRNLNGIHGDDDEGLITNL